MQQNAAHSWEFHAANIRSRQLPGQAQLRWSCETARIITWLNSLNARCAEATRNFLALENHSLDVPFWQDLVTEVEKPIIDKGYIKVSDTPGLGVTLNDDEVKRHLKPGTGYFEPTPMWDEPQSWDDALFS